MEFADGIVQGANVTFKVIRRNELVEDRKPWKTHQVWDPMDVVVKLISPYFSGLSSGFCLGKLSRLNFMM
jgi:hypothetical protein